MGSKLLTTPVGTAAWPKLDTPDPKFGKYSIDLILKNEDAQPIIEKLIKMRDEYVPQALQEVNKDKLPKDKKKTLKIADPSFHKPELDDDGNETGRTIIKITAKGSYKRKGSDETVPAPPIPRFDAKGAPSKADVWGGSQVKVAYEPSLWFVPALGVGVSLRLRGVQIIELVSKGGGSPKTAEGFGFTKEDGYTEEKNDSKGDDNGEPPMAPPSNESGDF